VCPGPGHWRKTGPRALRVAIYKVLRQILVGMLAHK
jgi:hypothetical protein